MPASLGRLKGLRQLYWASSGMTNGSLPETLSELRQLETLSLTGNAFTGERTWERN